MKGSPMRPSALRLGQHLAALLACSAVMHFGCSRSPQQNPKQDHKPNMVVNFGVQPALMPIYIARALGYLAQVEAKHNVKIELRQFSYGAPENQALGAGELQIASAGMGPAMIAAARLPAKLLAIEILEQTALLVPSSSGITRIAQLKGARIAYPGRGSQQYPLLLKALSDAGLAEDDVTLLKADGSDIPTLLMNRDVEAGITWDPHASAALQAGHSRILAKAEDIFPIKNGHYVGNGVYAREDFIAGHPELVQDLITAIVRAIDVILKDPSQAARLWAQEIGISYDVALYSLSNGVSVYSLDVVPDPETMRSYTAFLRTAGVIEATDEPKFETRFAKKALEVVLQSVAQGQ